MTSHSSQGDLDDYSRVLTAFVELRGKGVAVSRQDLEVLNAWMADGFPPSAIIEQLKALDQPVRTAIRRGSEY
jgi:hypothetical protein